MDPLGKSIEHSKIFVPSAHDSIKPPGPSFPEEVEPFVMHQTGREEIPPSPKDVASGIVSGAWDNDLLAKLMDDMKKLSAQRPPLTTIGNHDLGNWAFDSLMNMPMPGAGLYAPGIRGGLGNSSFYRDIPPEPPMDLTSAPAFLADERKNAGTGGSDSKSLSEKPSRESFPADSAYAKALRQTMRKDTCASLPVLFEELSKKEITPKECGRQLAELADKVEKSGDPISVMLLKRFLNQLAYRVPGSDPADISRLPELSPSLYVKYFGGDGGAWCPPLALANADVIAAYLKDVQRQAGSVSIDHDMLRFVAHLAKEAKGKATIEDITNKGSTISFKEIARGAAFLVNSWWQNGQVDIVANGKAVNPGDVDLGKILTAESVAVKGSTIDIGEYPPKERNPEALKLAKKFRSIGSSFSDETRKNALAECRDAAEKAPDCAREALDSYIEGLCPGPGKRLTTLSSLDASMFMECAKDEPWLKDLIAPQVDRIKGFAAEAESRNILDGENARDLVGVYEGLAKAFPEAVDERFMADSLTPLLLCTHGDSIYHSRDEAVKLVKECWKKDPGMVKPTIDAILKDRENSYLDDSVWQLIKSGAKKYGYEPGSEQLEQVAARLAHPSLPEGGTLFDYGSRDKDYVGALGLLKVLKDRKPALLKGIEVPDSRGTIVTLERGLADRILADPKASLYLERFIVDESKPDRFNFMGNLYSLLSGNSEVRSDLLQILESDYQNAGSIDAMGAKGKVALAMLAHMGPEKYQEPAVMAVLSKEVLKRQSDKALDRIVSHAREDETGKLLASISGGALPPDEAFQMADRIIAMGFSTIGSDMALEPCFGRIREAMQGAAGDSGFIPHRDGVAAQIEKSWKKAGNVGDMPVEDIRKLYLLLVLAGDDEPPSASLPGGRPLFSRLEPLMKDELKRDRSMSFTRTAHQHEAGAALDQYRRLLIEKNIELLRTGNLPPNKRSALDVENDRNKLGFDISQERRFDDKSRDALLEGAAKDYESPEVDRFMTYFNDKGEARWAFTVIARMTDRGEEIPGQCKTLLSLLDAQPDKEKQAVQGFSSTWDEDGEVVNTPFSNEDKRLMKKDLSKAISTYVISRLDDKLREFDQRPLTRSERIALVDKGKSCHTMLHYGSPSQEIISRTYSAFCRSLSNADPATGITDLPDHFKDPQTAYQIYITLAPDANRDEEIGPEWQKFKGILTAFGGDQNLDGAIEAYGFAKKKETEGYAWDKVLTHIYKTASLGQDYKETPIRDETEPPQAAAIVEEFEDDLFIGGVRLSKNE